MRGLRSRTASLQGTAPSRMAPVARPDCGGPIDVHWSPVGYVGAGGSDLAWLAIAGLRCASFPVEVARLGDRHLKVDCHRDDFLYDIATGGLDAGVGLRF